MKVKGIFRSFFLWSDCVTRGVFFERRSGTGKRAYPTNKEGKSDAKRKSGKVPIVALNVLVAVAKRI
jgi:hypothetical protein